MRKRAGGGRPRTLTGRLLLWQAIAVLGVLVALPLTIVGSKGGGVRVILVVGFGLAALAGVLVLVVLAGGLSRPLRRITDAVGRVGSGDLDADVPEQGTEELVLLAQTVNTMRREVAARAATAQEERTARDAILSGLDEGIVLFDPDGSTVYQNEQVARLLGGPVDAANRLGPPGLQELVAEVTGTGAARTTEVAAAARTLSATAARVPGDLRVLLVLRDVTRARILDAVRRDFVANASHELKTPAASISALAETIASAASDDPEATRRFAGQLEREAVRLAGIVSDLLDLSRLEVGMEEPSDLRFDQLVEDEAGRFDGRAEQSELTLNVQTEPVTVRGSPQDLALLVRNLVANAIQYTKPGGRIDVRVEANGSSAALVVRDTGIGIPAKDRGRIFERFYRVDRARSRETGGTGLGLSIVRHVVENHGGSVRVESELGEGSTFTVRLPLAA